MTSAIPLAPPRRESFARRRLYRLMTLSLAITAIVEVASVIPAMFGQADVLTPAYTAAAAVVIITPSVIALVLFHAGPMHVLRRIWRGQAWGMLGVYLALPIVLGWTRVPERFGLTWLGELEIIAACAAVLAFRGRALAMYAVVWQAVMFSIAIFWCENPWLGRSFGDALRQLFFVSMFGALALALLRAGRTLDAAVDDAVREVSQAAASAARRAARDRVQMLVHDRIIVALLAYAGGAGPERSTHEASTALEEIRHGPIDAGDATPRQLVWRLQAVTTRLDPAVRFDGADLGGADGAVDVGTGGAEKGDAVGGAAEGDAAGGAADDGRIIRSIPADVSAAFEEALGEALRNSLEHASSVRAVNRQVRATATPDRVEVVVLDDGDGFDTSRLDATRLGVRQGILRRMRSVGGEAGVRSGRGYGTIVSLTWQRA